MYLHIWFTLKLSTTKPTESSDSLVNALLNLKKWFRDHFGIIAKIVRYSLQTTYKCNNQGIIAISINTTLSDVCARLINLECSALSNRNSYAHQGWVSAKMMWSKLLNRAMECARMKLARIKDLDYTQQASQASLMEIKKW